MAVGDVVSGFSTTFQPASSVSVIITFAGINSGDTETGFTNGSSYSRTFIPAYNKYQGSYQPTNSRGIGLWKIPINNTNYFVGNDGYSGIQIA